MLSGSSWEGDITAQEAYARMLNDEIAPALRRAGFRGSRGCFYLPDDEDWIALGFQKSAWSDRAEVRFTVNVSVISKTQWAQRRERIPRRPKRPACNTFYGSWAAQTRIGELLPDAGDRWWSVRDFTDSVERLRHGGALREPTGPVAKEVIQAIVDQALPWIEAVRTGRQHDESRSSSGT